MSSGEPVSLSEDTEVGLPAELGAGSRRQPEARRDVRDLAPWPPTLDLVLQLCRVLNAEKINYCHWKGNAGAERSARGDGDIDLLISRADAQRFHHCLRRLGFKYSIPPPHRQFPAVFHAFGLDAPSGRLVHVHGYLQLLVGHDLTSNYRLPVEDAYLASARPGEPFRVPAPELEFIQLVVRLVLVHSTWDAVLTRQASLSATERAKFEQLRRLADRKETRDALGRYLPAIDTHLWDRCMRSLEPSCSVAFRMRTAARLQRALADFAR